MKRWTYTEFGEHKQFRVYVYTLVDGCKFISDMNECYICIQDEILSPKTWLGLCLNYPNSTLIEKFT